MLGDDDASTAARYELDYSLAAPLTPILVVVMLHAAAVALVITPLTDLVADVVYDGDLQAAALFLSLLEGAIALMQLVSDPAWGHLSDILLGRKIPLLLAVVQMGLEMIVLWWMPTWWTLVFCGIARGLCGVGFTLASIMLMDLSGSGPLGPRLIGLYGASSGFGFLVGAMGGVLLGASYGLPAPFLMAAIVEGVNGVWILSMIPSEPLTPIAPELEELVDEDSPIIGGFQQAQYGSLNGRAVSASATSPARQRHSHSIYSSFNPFFTLRILFETSSLKWLSLAFFLGFLGRAYAKIFFVWTKLRLGWNMRSNGIFLGFVGFLSIIVQGALMKRASRWFHSGEEGLLKCALGLNIVAALGYSFLPNENHHGAILLYLLTIATSLGFLFLPLLRARMSREVPACKQGVLGGAAASLVTGASVFGAIIYGPLFAYWTGGASESEVRGEDQLPPSAPLLPPLHGAPFYFPGAPFIAAAVVLLITFPPLSRAFKMKSLDLQSKADKQAERIAKRPYQTAGEEDALIEGGK